MNEAAHAAMSGITRAGRDGRVAAQCGKRCSVARYVKAHPLPQVTVEELVEYCYTLGYKVGKRTEPWVVAVFTGLDAAHAERERSTFEALPGGKAP